MTYFKRKSKGLTGDLQVDSAISKLDFAVNQFGTDEELIFETLKSLSSSEIKKLFKGFGFRYYNQLTGQYSLISILEGFAVARQMDLKEILLNELSSDDIENLKNILLDKNYNF